MRSGFRVWIDGNPVEEIFDLGYTPDRIAFLELQKQHKDRLSATCPYGCPLTSRSAHLRQGTYVEVTLTHTRGQRDLCPHSTNESGSESKQHQDLKNLLRDLGTKLGQDPRLELVEVNAGESPTMRIDVVWAKANIAWEVDVTPKSLGRSLVRSGRQESAGYEHSIAVFPRGKKWVFQPVVKALAVNTDWDGNPFEAFVAPVYRQRVDQDSYEVVWELVRVGIERFSRGLLERLLDWREISPRRRGWCVALTVEELMIASRLHAQRSEQNLLEQRAAEASREKRELEHQLLHTEHQLKHRTVGLDRVAAVLERLGLTSNGNSPTPADETDPWGAFNNSLLTLLKIEGHRPWWKRVLLEPPLRFLGIRPRVDRACIEAHTLGEQAVNFLQDKISNLREKIDTAAAHEDSLLAASQKEAVALAAACRQLDSFPWARGKSRR